MRQRTLGILGGALLIGGVVLGIATGIAAGYVASQDTPNGAAGIQRPNGPGLPGHKGRGGPGPIFNVPGQRGFPGPSSPTTSG